MCVSLPISLLAAFVAIMRKQWLRWYLQNASGLVARRCGYRRPKYNGLNISETGDASKSEE